MVLYSLSASKSIKCKAPTKNGICGCSVSNFNNSHYGFCISCYYSGIVEDYAKFSDMVKRGISRFEAALKIGFIELDD